MTIERAGRAAAALVLMVLAAGCASTTKLSGVWKDPALSGKKLGKVAVLAVAEDGSRRRTVERTFVRKLEPKGVSAIVGDTLVPDLAAAKENREAFVERLRGAGVETILVSRVVSLDRDLKTNEGYSYTIPYSYYYGFYSYVGTAYATMYRSGAREEKTDVRIESNVYDLASEKLIWSGVSESIDPDDPLQVIETFTDVVVAGLARDGLL